MIDLKVNITFWRTNLNNKNKMSAFLTAFKKIVEATVQTGPNRPGQGTTISLHGKSRVCEMFVAIQK